MDWFRGEKLGHGSFGTVSLAVPTKQSTLFPPLMAVKSCGVLYSSSLAKEKLILEELKDCPEIIQCYGDGFSYENREKLYNVLLEYAAGSDLYSKILNSDDQKLPEIEVRRYTKALLKGINYIHKSGYVHCDIKLQNILLTSNGDLKISDFGLSKRVGEKESGVSMGQFKGTPLNMSPEIVVAGELEPPADIWALGCSVVEMITGAPAWRVSDLAELLMTIGVGEEVPEIPGYLSDEGKDFLGKCFVKDPSKRWTAKMLLNHPFVRGDERLRFDDVTVSLKERQEKIASISPKCPFEFPEWVESDTCSITKLGSPEYFEESGRWFSEESNEPSWAAERLRGLVSNQGPNWSVSEDWVTIK